MKNAIKKMLFTNAIWNSAGIAAAILGGFITAPFLIHHLGTDIYSVWVLIGSLDGYLGLLDLGVRGSVGRNIALHRSLNDPKALRAIYRSALAIQTCVSAAGIIASVVAISLFFHLFDVPLAQVGAAKWALIIMAAGIVIEFPMCVFDATLWGLNRFDLLNAIDIPAIIARTVLTIALVARGEGLVALALVNVLLTVGTHFAKAIALFVIEPGLRDLWPKFDSQSTRQLFNWGFWSFVISLCRTIADQASTVIVASVIALSLVMPLSVAARLIAYASALLVAASDVIMPLATGLHADGDRQRQKILLLESAKRCTALAIVIGAGLAFLGGPFLALWIGHQAMPAWRLLPVMVVGSLLPISQRLAYSVVLAAGKHKVLAISAMLENAVAIPVALLLAPRFGMFGVCACFASAAVLNQLAFHMYTGCALTHISMARCVWETMALPAAILAVPIMGLAMLVAVAPPGGWVKLLLEAAVFLLACLGAWNAVVLMKRARHFIRAISPVDSPASASFSATVE